MYKVSKGPREAIVNKTRRDFKERLENLDRPKFFELTRKRSNSPKDNLGIMSSPMPTFQNVGNKNNKASNGRQNPKSQEPFCPQHIELIKYFHETFERAERELSTSGQRGNGVLRFNPDRPPHPEVANCTPFDLEGYWGKKVYTNTTQLR